MEEEVLALKGSSGTEQSGSVRSISRDVPTGLAASSINGAVLLSWDSGGPGGVLATQVYRASSDSRSSARMIGESSSSQFTDPVGAGSESYYYWVRYRFETGVGGFNTVQGVSSSGTVEGELRSASELIEEGTVDTPILGQNAATNSFVVIGVPVNYPGGNAVHEILQINLAAVDTAIRSLGGVVFIVSGWVDTVTAANPGAFEIKLQRASGSDWVDLRGIQIKCPSGNTGMTYAFLAYEMGASDEAINYRVTAKGINSPPANDFVFFTDVLAFEGYR